MARNPFLFRIAIGAGSKAARWVASIAAAVLFVFLAAPGAWAGNTNYIWDVSSGSWSNTANWSGGVVPVTTPPSSFATALWNVNNATMFVDTPGTIGYMEGDGSNLSLTVNGGTLNFNSLNGEGGVADVDAAFIAESNSTAANTGKLTFNNPLVVNGGAGNMHVGGDDNWGQRLGTIVFANTGNSWNNTYILNNATVQLGIAGGLPSTTNVYLGTSTVWGFNSNLGYKGTLDLNGYNQTVAGLQVAGGNTADAGNVVTDSSATPAVLTINNSSNDTYAGSLTGAGLGLTKSGNGLLMLSASNTYGGATTVSAGTLALGAGGSVNSSGMISLARGTTLDVSALGTTFHLGSGQTLTGAGNYTVNGAMTANSGSVILPGGTASAGTLNVGALTLSTGSILNYDLGSAQDLIDVTNSGGLVVNGGSISLYQAGGASQFSSPGTYTLMDYVGSLGGSAVNLSVANANPADSYTFNSSGGSLTLTIAALGQTWNGGGNPPTWSNTANWNTAQAPLSGNPLVFSGSLGLSNTNDMTGLNVTGIVFSTSAGAFNISGNSIQLSGAVLNSSTATQTIGLNMGLAGNQSFNAAPGNIVLSGVIGDAGSPGGIVKTGSGALALTASNTYSGGTTLNAGTLQVGNPGALGSGTFTINGGAVTSSGTTGYTLANPVSLAGNATLGDFTNNGALVFSGPVTLGAATVQLAVNSPVTISGAIGGGSGLTMLGPSLLTLNGGNTYAGATTISAGTLQLGCGGAAGTLASSSVSDFGTLGFNHSDSVTFGAAIGGSGGLYNTGGGTLALTGSNSYSGPTIVNGGSLVGNTASLPGPISLVNGANVTFNQTANGAFSQTISGTGSLIIQGGGALALAASQSYCGPTIVSGGTLLLQGPTAPQSLVALYQFNGSTTADTGSKLGAFSGQTFNGTASGSPALVNDAPPGVSDVAQSLLLNGSSSISLPLTGVNPLAASNSFTITAWFKTGLSDSQVNPSGGTTGSGEAFFSATAGGNTTSSFDFYVGNPYGFNAQGALVGDSYANSPAAYAGSALNDGQWHFAVFTRTSANIWDVTVTTPGGATVSGTSSPAYNPASPTAITIGAPAFSGLSAWTGELSDVAIFQGVLSSAEQTQVENGNFAGYLQGIGINNILPATTPLTIAAAATVDLAGANQTVGSLTGDFGSFLQLDGGTLTTGGDGTSTSFNGTISGSGAFVKTGSGTLTLGAVNGFAGLTDVQAGTLLFGAPAAIGSDLRISGGTLDMGGYSSQVGNLTLASGAITDGGPLYGIAYNLQNGIVSASLGDIDGSPLIKTTTGTVVLSGANTYAGPTTVCGGTLAIAAGGSIDNTSAITVAAGATMDVSALNASPFTVVGKTLTVNGTFVGNLVIIAGSTLDGTGLLTGGGSVTTNNSFVNPGSGTLSVGTALLPTALNLGDNSVYVWGVGPAAGMIQVNGSLAIGNNVTVQPVALGGPLAPGGTYTVMTWTGADPINTPTLNFASAASATVQWTGSAATSNWDDGENWDSMAFSGGTLSKVGKSFQVSGLIESFPGPQPSSDVVIAPAGGIAVLGSASPRTVNSLTIGDGGANATSLTVQPGGPLTVITAATINSNGVLLLDGSMTSTSVISAGTLQIGNADANGGLNAAATIANNGSLIFNRTDNYGGPIANSVSGTGAVTLAGGMLTLTGANSYSGGTTLAGGTLAIGGASALGSGTLAIGDGTTIQAAGGPQSANNPVAVGGSFIVGGANDLQLCGPMNLVGTNSTWTINNAGGTTFSGAITSSSAVTVTKAGAGTLVLGGSNSYSGTTAIAAGTLSLNNPAALPAGTALAFQGGTLQYTANNTVDYSSAIQNSTGPIVIDTNGQNVTYSGFLSSSNVGGFNKIGAGLLAVAGQAAYGGSTIVSGGTLQISGNNYSPNLLNGSFAAPSIAGNSELVYNTMNSSQTASLAWSSSGNGGNGAILMNTSSIWFYTTPYPGGNQAISLQGTSWLGQSVLLAAGTYDISWSAQGRPGTANAAYETNPFYFQVNGVNQGGEYTPTQGAWTSESDTFTVNTPGVYTISFLGTNTNGVYYASALANVALAPVDVLPFQTLPTSPVSVAAGAVLDLDGNSQQVASLCGAGMVINSNTVTPATLTIGDATNQSSTFSGTISDAGAAPLSLVTAGAGTLILSGTNTYSGGTIVSEGTLVLDDSEALADGSSLIVGDASAFSAVQPATTVPAVGSLGGVAIAAVPEPCTFVLLAFGLCSAAIYRRYLRWRRR